MTYLKKNGFVKKSYEKICNDLVNNLHIKTIEVCKPRSHAGLISDFKDDEIVETYDCYYWNISPMNATEKHSIINKLDVIFNENEIDYFYTYGIKDFAVHIKDIDKAKDFITKLILEI